MKTIAKALVAAGLSLAALMPVAAAEATVRVGSYNILTSSKYQDTDDSWASRRASVVALLKKLDLDVFGIQEVRDDQREYLKEQLTDYAIVGHRIWQDGRSVDTSVPVVYRTSRFTRESYGTFWLSETPDTPGSKSWDAAESRICTYAILIDNQTGRRLVFANTHLDHQSAAARANGARLIVSRLKEIANGAPTVLVGDHNCYETDAPAQTFRRVFSDALYVSETPPAGSWRSFNGRNWRETETNAVEALALTPAARNASKFQSAIGGKRIDFIYTLPEMSVRDFSTVNDTRSSGGTTYPSDHFPVVATLAYPPLARDGEMYYNRLSSGSETVPAGTYGGIVVPAGGFAATLLKSGAKLPQTAGDFGGSYAGIISSHTYSSKPYSDLDTHTVSGWFKITSSKSQQMLFATTYLASGSNDHAGNRVDVTSAGKLVIGKAKMPLSGGFYGTKVTSTGTVPLDQWFYLTVAITSGHGSTTDKRVSTAKVYVNGSALAMPTTSFPSNYNGYPCAAIFTGAIRCAGLRVDSRAVTGAAIMQAWATDPRYVGRLRYAATVGSAGAKNLTALSWSPSPFAPTQYDDVTVTVDPAVKGEVVLNLDKADLAVGTFKVVSTGGATLKLTGANPAKIEKWDFTGFAGRVAFGFVPDVGKIDRGAGELVLWDYVGGKRAAVGAGTTLRLGWTGKPSADPFSPEGGAVAGVLDLGGATQAFATDNGEELFVNGGEFRNGTFDVKFTVNWWGLSGTTFTIGPGATLLTSPDGDAEKKGEMNFQGKAKLVIDGGTVCNRNNRDGDLCGHYIGCDQANTAEIRIIRGGTFKSKYKFVRIGTHSKATGILSVDNGTVNVADGERFLSVASGEGDKNPATGIVALTNATLVAKSLVFGERVAGGTARVTLKDTTAMIERIYANKALASGSSIVFDNFRLVPTGGEADVIAATNLPKVTIAAGGLTVSNATDTSVSAPMAGAGGLVKMGAGTLALAGSQTFAGGIAVREGGIAVGCTMPGGVLFASDGTRVAVALAADGFTTRNMALALDPATTGKVKVVVNGELEPDRKYALFKQGTMTAATLARLEPVGYFAFVIEDGEVRVFDVSPRTFVWTGACATTNDAWSLAGNWDVAAVPKRNTAIVFTGGKRHTTYDLADGVAYSNVTVRGGTCAIDLAGAAFTNTPVAVAKGATLALENAAGRVNPFSTTAGDNAIAGVLDLGGATQDFDPGKRAVVSGGELRNGTVNLNFSGFWFVEKGMSVTFGKGAKVYTPDAGTDSTIGQLAIRKGRMTIDGGYVCNRCNRGSGYGHYIGDTVAETGELRIINGGTFESKYLYMRIGNNGGGTGVLAVTNGTVNVADGARELHVASSEGTTGVLAFSNATLTASAIRVCRETNASNVAWMTFKDSTLTLNNITCNSQAAAGSFVVFDGTTFRSLGNKKPLANIGVPYQIVGNGLTLDASKNADKVVSVTGEITGGGMFVKKGSDVLKITGAASTYTGTLDIRGGGLTSAKQFGGGLTAASGVTLDVGGATFAGRVAVAAGVKFAGVDPTKEQPEYQTTPKVLVRTRGEIAAEGLLAEEYGTTRNRFFVMRKDGYCCLCYGSRMGITVFVR